MSTYELSTLSGCRHPSLSSVSTRHPSTVAGQQGRSAGTVPGFKPKSTQQAEHLAQQLSLARRTAEELKGRIAGQKEGLIDTTLRAVGTQTVPRLESGVGMRVRRTLKGHLAKVYALQWARDSRHIVSVGQDGKLIVWDAYTSNKVHAIPLRFQWVMDCAVSPSGRLVATGGLENICYVFRLPDVNEDPIDSAANGSSYNPAAQPVRELTGHLAFMSHCEFVSDYEMLTSSGDRSCMLWDVETGQSKAEYLEHNADVMGLALHPTNPSVFISGACDGFAKVWDTRSSKGSVQSFHAHDLDVNAITFFPDGNALATGAEDATCKLFDLRADRALAAYSHPMLRQQVTSLEFTHSGRLLAVGYDDAQVQVWDTLRTDRVGSLIGHESRVSCLGVSPDGKALCTGSWDARLLVWAP